MCTRRHCQQWRKEQIPTRDLSTTYMFLLEKKNNLQNRGGACGEILRSHGKEMGAEKTNLVASNINDIRVDCAKLQTVCAFKIPGRHCHKRMLKIRGCTNIGSVSNTKTEANVE